MAQTKQVKKVQEKDILTRLTGAGEDAIQRVADLPGGKVMVETAHNVRELIDDVAARLRSIDPLEKRVSAIEKRLNALEKPGKKAPARKRSSKPKTAPSTPAPAPAPIPEPVAAVPSREFPA